MIVVAALATSAACGGGRETVMNARPRTVIPIAHGDCAEANRRAAAEPDLDVDSVPRVVRQRPAPFTQMPDSVKRAISASGSSVKVNVLVDTLGRPVMQTFTVVESTHPWLVQNLKLAMPSWRFRAARLAGCKVARVYRFSATSRARR